MTAQQKAIAESLVHDIGVMLLQLERVLRTSSKLPEGVAFEFDAVDRAWHRFEEKFSE
jgi:hypothetical protein